MQCCENLLRFETRFDTPADSPAAWWRIAWAREGGIPWIPVPGHRGTGQVRASPGVDPDRGTLNASELATHHQTTMLF